MTRYTPPLQQRFAAEFQDMRRRLRKVETRTSGIDSGMPLAVQPAVVDPGYTTGQPYVYINGSSTLTGPCLYSSSYAPVAGDQVLVVPLPVTAGLGQGVYLIIGQINGGVPGRIVPGGGLTGLPIRVYDFAPNPLPVGVVQATQREVQNAATAAVAIKPTQPGNCLVVVAVTANATTNATVESVTADNLADNFGALYSVGSTTGSAGAVISWWADPDCAGGQTEVEVTTEGGAGDSLLTVFVLEAQGLATSIGGLLDQFTGEPSGGPSEDWSSGSTAETTNANELWIGAAGAWTTTPNIANGPGSPWTNLDAALNLAAAGYQVVSAEGEASYAGTFGTSTDWTAGVITLKPATAGNLLASFASGAFTDEAGNDIPQGAQILTGQVATTVLNGTVPATQILETGSIEKALLSATITSTSLGGITTTISATAPANPNVGDIWINSANGFQMERWNGSAWVPIIWNASNVLQGNSIQQAQLATSITSRTLGGITTTIAATAPASPVTGDMWINSASGYQLEQWSGSAWVPITFNGSNVLGSGTVTAAQIYSGTVQADRIQTGNIAANAIQAGQIAAGAIQAGALQAGAVIANDIAAEVVTASNLVVSYDGQVAQDSPIAWWKLDDLAGSTTVNDYGPGNHDGTATNVSFQQAQAVAAVPSAKFNGSSEVVTTWQPGAFSAITIEAWLNLEGLTQGSFADLVSSSHTDSSNLGFDVYYTSSAGTVTCSLGNGSTKADVASAVPATGWSHIVITYDGTTQRMYLNGAQVASGTSLTGSVAADTSNHVSLGFTAGGGNLLNGLLSEVAIYTTALSAARVSAHYAAKTGSIVAANIASDTITAAQIAAQTITASEIAAGSLTAGLLAAGAVVAGDIAAQAVTASNLVVSYDGQVQQDSPAGWWKLDDPAGSTTVQDYSGGGHPGTASNVTFQQAQAVAAVPSASFNGTTSEVVTTYTPPALTAFTVEIWINLNGATQSTSFPQAIGNSNTSGTDKGFQLYVNASSRFPEINIGTGTAWAGYGLGAALPASGWTHLVATYDGAHVTCYQNGVQVSQTALTGSIPADGAITIGTAVGNTGNQYAGLLSEAVVYTTALSPARIAAHYAAKTGSIVAANIASDTITAVQIAAHTITANEIAANTIGANQIVANLVYAGIVNGTLIEGAQFVASGTGAGIGYFEYSGTPGPGNFPIAWSVPSSVTHDPFGNTLPVSGGFATISGLGAIVQLDNGTASFWGGLPSSYATSGGVGVGVGSHSLTLTSPQKTGDNQAAVLLTGDPTNPRTQVTEGSFVVGSSAPATSALVEVQGTVAAPLVEATVSGVAETWHSLGTLPVTGVTTAVGRYRMLPDGDVEIDISLSTAAAVATFSATFPNSLPAAYQPTQNKIGAIAATGAAWTISSSRMPNVLVAGGTVQVNMPAIPGAVANIGCTFRYPTN